MINERQQALLKTIVEEYIKDAKPVGSKKLAETFNFGIGSAMIRQELATLESAGLLAQPHTSSGRIPTDKAYRFYISNNLSRKPSVLSRYDREKIDRSITGSGDAAEMMREVSKVLSQLSREFSATGLMGQDFIYTCGLGQLIEEPELQEDYSSVSGMLKFVDDIDEHFMQIWQEPASEGLKIFIGQENPIREIRNFTLITSQYRLPKGEQGFVSIIGPKRMDYSRNMALVDYIKQRINDITS